MPLPGGTEFNRIVQILFKKRLAGKSITDAVYRFNIRSIGQRSMPRGYNVQKHISGDRVAAWVCTLLSGQRLVQLDDPFDYQVCDVMLELNHSYMIKRL